MRASRGCTGLATVIFASQLSAAVEVLGDLGLSSTRRRDGVPLIFSSLQPGLLIHSDDPWCFTVGVRAGPAGFWDSDASEWGAGLEARLLAGAGWSSHRVRLDLLASGGGGLWHESGAGPVVGWARSLGAELMATWALSGRLRCGPNAGWCVRRLENRDIEEVRVAGALLYRLD